ncbi:unnamed protein product [Owenia fusiformis]|uniref:Lipocalin/cytosolic fatty-acid binding domain-containing protein n=1 Tax=Owenia fusiformis TaxID=6347 RepID=A0A8S4MYU6_OWEFU|nr:unnamed protein product [Owenia fusiformis]
MQKYQIQHILYVIFLGILTTVTAEKCVLNMTSLDLQSNFNFDEFMGRWFEVKAWFHIGIDDDWLLDNFSIQYTKRSSGVADVLETGTPKNSSDCESWPESGLKMQLVSSTGSHPARLAIRTTNTSSGESEDREFYVVETDFYNYALIVTCTWENILYANGTCLPDPIVHVLSRTNNLRSVDETRVYDIINRKICHAGLDEFRSNFQGTPCSVPGDPSSSPWLGLSPWLHSLVALISIFNCCLM